MKCENCNNDHDGSYGSGRFCSSKCARGFSTKEKRKEINKKVSKKLNKQTKCIHCSIKIKSTNKLSVCIKCLYKDDRYKIKLSNSTKGKCGGYRKGSGRSKGGYFNNQYFDSTFEIEVAQFFIKNNIKWERNTKRFYFIWNGKKTYYIPDFYLPDINKYLETKGYWYSNKEEKTKFAAKDNKIDLVILTQKEWLKDKNIIFNKIMSE